LRERLVEPRQEALLELGGAELVAGPPELLRNHDLNVESLPASRIEEVVADPFPLEEGIGAVHGPLDHIRRLLGTEAHSFQLFGSRWNQQANGKDALTTPVPLLVLEAAQGLRPFVTTYTRGALGLAFVVAIERDDDGGGNRRPAIIGSLKRWNLAFRLGRPLLDPRFHPAEFVRASPRCGLQAGGKAPDFIGEPRFEGGPQALRFNAAWRTVGLAALVEVHSSVEVSAGRPRDHSDAPVRLVGKARGPRCGGLQERPTMRLQRPAEVAISTLDPESDHVKDPPRLDIA
jgi:hypothetical protein